MECSPDRIHDYAYDLLPEEEAAAVRRHTYGCTACASLTEGYRRETSLLEAALSVEPRGESCQGKRRTARHPSLTIVLAFAACFIAALAGWLLGVFGKREGYPVKATYQLSFEDARPTDRHALAKETCGVIERRLHAIGLNEVHVRFDGSDLITVSVPTSLESRLIDADAVIAPRGKLRLYASSDRASQERYKKDGQVPEGYIVMVHDQPLGEEYAVFQDRMLLKKDPVITGRHIQTAQHQQQMSIGRGLQWAVGFELKADGARMFDEAAKALFNQTPQGLMVIVFDGKVISAPRVNAEHFGGCGIIEGEFDENKARNLAALLQSGELQVPLRRIQGMK